MRSSLVVRASDCQCTSCNGPEFDPLKNIFLIYRSNLFLQFADLRFADLFFGDLKLPQIYIFSFRKYWLKRLCEKFSRITCGQILGGFAMKGPKRGSTFCFILSTYRVLWWKICGFADWHTREICGFWTNQNFCCRFAIYGLAHLKNLRIFGIKKMFAYCTLWL